MGPNSDGLWPTPVASGADERSTRYAQGGMPLGMAVRIGGRADPDGATWPTPTATDGIRDGRTERSGIPDHVLSSPTPVSGHNLGLSHAARLWPTPLASEAAQRGGSSYTPSEEAGTHGKMLVSSVREVEGPTPHPDRPRLWPTPVAGDAERNVVMAGLRYAF